MGNNVLVILIIIASYFKGVAQPAPYKGTLLFNLTEKEHTGEYIKVEGFKSKKVQLLSFDKESELTYDTLNKAFSFTTKGAVNKSFAIIYNSKTIFIHYPSLPSLAVKVVMPIPLVGNSFSFYNSHIYDAIHSNKDYNSSRIFNLCQGCFISKEYQMEEKTKKWLIDNVNKLNKVELKE